MGANGALVHYDGGSWNSVTGPVGNNLNAVWGSGSRFIFAVGDNGVLIRYDGGSWVQDGSPTTSDMHAVYAFNTNDVFAVGANGTILQWNCCDWNQQTSPTTETLRAVWGASATADVLAAGDNGTVVQFDGSIWISLRTGTTETFYGGWGSPNPTFRAAGTAGTIRLGSRGASVSVAPGLDTLTAVGNALQMSAQVQDAFGRVAASGDIFTWQSSGPAILSIDAAGLAAPQANGTVTVTATNGDLSGTASIVVNQLGTSATLAPNAVTLALGGTVQLTLRSFDANSNEILGRTPNWTTADAAIAGVKPPPRVTREPPLEIRPAGPHGSPCGSVEYPSYQSAVHSQRLPNMS